jgi:hypothetical protein
MTTEQLVSVSGLALSLGFFYIPGLNTWYDSQNSQAKAAVMGGLLLVVTAAAYGLSCVADFAYFECTQTGAWAAVTLFARALAVNQGTYMLARNLPGAK